ncbi:hypothetical protein [Fischerella sp. PCC 9605]|uniref:hypothetical protein n=1 Tax=Fischerella sp. PCC 9605 TaxID=1173024 RepID=UPI00047DEF48|nr:hypothetical protein [Fischerella sp. PCC 9605]
MISKIITPFQLDRDSFASPQSWLNPVFRSLVALLVLILLFGGLGWFAGLNHSFSQVAIIMSILTVAAVRICWLAGFTVWAGLWSLTFGSALILVGTLTSSGLYGWAVAIALMSMGIFTLDLALSDSVKQLLKTGLSQMQVFWLLVIVCTSSVMMGWTLPIWFAA